MDSPGATSASIPTDRSQLLYRRFLSDAAACLTFAADTQTGLAAHAASYSQARFSRLFRPTGALSPARRTPGRRLYRPAPGPKHRQALQEPPGSTRFPPLPEPPESADHRPPQRRLLLQDSRGRTRVADLSQIISNDSKYHRNLQRWSPPGLDTTTTPTSKKTGTTENPNGDLNDPQDQVQTRRPRSDSAGADSWGAARRLALDGDHSRGVVQRLLAQLFQDDQPEDQDQAPSSQNQPPSSQNKPPSNQNKPPSSQDQPPSNQDQPPSSQGQPPSSQDQPPNVQFVVSLLIFLSGQTTLVRSLLAEQLNSSESKNRLLACQTLSSLQGPVNQDVVHKLTHLMWTDQSEPVRHAAAETLMKLGKVQHVHTQLRLKLEDGRGLQGRMGALDLISSLKLMTVKLLESLVSCFKDEFTAVRRQACVTAAALLLQDETVVSRLLDLVENDPAREVRLSAITAVGALGLSSAAVQETLRRCVETEEEAELRLAACRLLQSVGVPLDELHDFLLQRVDAESNWLVRRTMKEMLRLSDCGLQGERRHAQFFSLQAKRLCESRVVADKVLLLEKLQEGKREGRHLPPRTLARLLSLRCAEYDERTDEH